MSQEGLSARFPSAVRLLSANAFLFILFTVGFALWRYGQPIVWDDTSVYKVGCQAWKICGSADWPTKFLAYIVPSFSEATPSGYRPIANILQSLFILTIDSTLPSWGHLVFVGCFIGGLAVAFKNIAARFIESKVIVYLCLTLFMFSSPMAQSSWISYSGIPALVPLFSCLGLLVYFQMCDRPGAGMGRMWLLSLIVIVSVWYREFMIALPLTIVAMETVRAQRVTRISVLAGVLIVICLFPTVIPYLLFKTYSLVSGYGQAGDTGAIRNGVLLPIKPVFKLGNVHAQLSGGMVIRDEVSRHLLSIPSPSLLILTFFGFGSLAILKFRQQIGAKELKLNAVIGLVAGATAAVIALIPLAGMVSPTVGRLWPYHFGLLGLIFGLVSVVVAWVCVRIGTKAENSGAAVISLSACVCGLAALVGIALPGMSSAWPLFSSWPYHSGVLALILIAWINDRRLAAWTVIFLAPFYLVYTERVHLAYAIMPLSIVVAMVLEQCWTAQPLRASSRRLMRFVVSTAAVVGVLDAGANLIAVYGVMTRIADGIEIVAHNVAARSAGRPVAIIGNGIHVDDLRLYLDNGYQLLWTIPSGHDRPQDVTETPAQLTKFLKAKLPTTDVYFLDMHQDYLPAKKYYHQHRFVAACSVDVDDLGSLHLTQVEYFMPDPLRWFVDRAYFAFLGPPDLVDDFYYGPSSRRFFGKVEADYRLYKVTSSKVKNWLPLHPVNLVDANFLGFSIVWQNELFFAIPNGEGEFSYERACRRRYSTVVEAGSLDDIKEKIKGLRATQ